MKFKKISIKNFRNFKDIEVELDNKNVFFGMNDVGKTNFLYALRYVFDRSIRKNNLVNTDFFQENTNEIIEIIVAIDISEDDPDSQKLRAKVKGAIYDEQDIVYIKLMAEYNKTDMSANPVLYWGSNLDDLEEVKSRGYSFEIDNVFDVIYIDAYVDLYSLFRKKADILLKNDDDEVNEVKLTEIKKNINDLNESISSLPGIKHFEEKVSPVYNDLRNENIKVSVKSEIGVNNLYSNVTPYIKNDDTENLYPTSGEGRKKLLVYSIYNLLGQDLNDEKIVLYLIEEPENHLHRSLQIQLSYQLFVQNKYTYTFMSTHSSYVLREMDDVNLIRIYSGDKIDSASSFYTVPEMYKNNKQILNNQLTEAVFADKVLLVEGPSEDLLFNKVLHSIEPYYQAMGIYVLPVGGVVFSLYVNIFAQLKIPYIVKTDNDLQKTRDGKYSATGFSRINDLIGKNILPKESIADMGDDLDLVEEKRRIYDKHKEALDKIRDEYNIYLSRVSLEEDLDECIHDEMAKYLPNAKGNVVDYLQKAKKYNMAELVGKLSVDDCKKICSHYNFKCIEDALK